jgi:hypothetical protein
MQMFYQYMRFEILMVVIVTAVTTFGLVERQQRFRETYYFYHLP